MKRISAIVILLALTLTYSCNKLKHIKFNKDINTSFAVPAVDTIGTLAITTPDLNTNIESIARENNTSPDLIQSVKVRALVLTITSPDAQSFSFLHDITIYMANNSVGEVAIASKQNMNETGKQLTLEVEDVELRPYLLSNAYHLRIAATTREAIPQPVNIDATIGFQFEANLLAVF